MKIVLASESASRRRAMDILGLAYEVHPSRIDGDGVIRFADHVSGSYNFATGVALNDLVALLRKHGVEI